MSEAISAQVSAQLDVLSTRRLLVVSGKGGVGRTTVSALLGWALSLRGRRVLVATTGHDDRLAWMFGLAALSERAQAVTPTLSLVRLEPAACVRDYGVLMLRSRRLANAVFDNPVVRRLLRSIPGFDDFAVLGKAWHEATRGDSYDLVIFDGPASGHLTLNLGVPDAIVDSVGEGPLSREARLMRSALMDPEVTAAVLVSLAEPWPLTEVSELARSLERDLSMTVGATVINRLRDPDLPQLDPSRVPEGKLRTFFTALGQAGEQGQAQRQALEAWARDKKVPAGCLIGLPWRPTEIDNMRALRHLAEQVMIVDQAEADQAELADQEEPAS